MHIEQLEVMSAIIAGGMVSKANHSDEPEATAKKSVAIAKAIMREVSKEAENEYRDSAE